jgi:hypothetical protein
MKKFYIYLKDKINKMICFIEKVELMGLICFTWTFAVLSLILLVFIVLNIIKIWT